MPQRYYANLVGLGAWGVIVYNMTTIWWLTTKGFARTDKKVAFLRAKEKYGSIGMWFAFLVGILGMLLMAIYCTLSFLNGIHGWYVFHVKDFMTPPFVIGMSVLPGMLICILWIMLALLVFGLLRQGFQCLFSDKD